MNPEEELRLECLRLALIHCAAGATEAIEQAGHMEAFVRKGSASDWKVS